MIDPKILRESPDIVEKAMHDKWIKWVDIKELIHLDSQRMKLKQELEQLRAKRNEISSNMKWWKPTEELMNQAKEIKDKIQNLEKTFTETEDSFYFLFKQVPNIPTDDTPVWLTEEENVVVKQRWNIRDFWFEAKNHYEIAEKKDWIDKERAAKIAGARFAYLKWDLVKLQFALINYVMSVLTDEDFLKEIIRDFKLNVSSKAFVPILPPYMIRTKPYDDMDRLEPREDRYKIEWHDLRLQGSAEHVLWSMYQWEVFQEEQLPIRYLWYATSFRGEAWTYWKDMEWIIRMHQFDKLEIESFSLWETSHEEYLFFSAIQEVLMQKLNLPYQKLQKCTFDIWKPNAKGSDIEARLPWQGKYRETHTADYMTDYQARRLQTRVKRKNWDMELIHTNDATAFAVWRALVAIMENYQTADWDVEIPEVLIPYMWWKTRI